MSTIESNYLTSPVDSLYAKPFLRNAKQIDETNDCSSPTLLLTRSSTCDTANIRGSLCDIEGLCSGTLGLDGPQNGSIASTNDSCGGFFSRGISLTKGQALELESELMQERGRAKLAKALEAQLLARADSPFEAVLEDEEMKSYTEEAHGSFDNLEETPRSPSQATVRVQEESSMICPMFDVESSSARDYIFSNDNKTMTQKNHKNPLYYSSIAGQAPLPSSGKCEFSVRIEKCAKTHPKLYVGITSSEVKEKNLAYKPGYYFLNCFDTQSYLNGLKTVKGETLPRQGQIVTVLIDMECGTISFEIDNVKVLEGKLNLSKTKTNEFYPFVCVGEPEGTVSFV
jgi:hypothetical protein